MPEHVNQHLQYTLVGFLFGVKIFDKKLLFLLVFRSFPDWLRMVFGGQTIRVLLEGVEGGFM